MTNDNGMDNPLPISKEGLLEALGVAIKQLNSINVYSDSDIAADELYAHKEYLEQLRQNIKDDACSNYPPVVRKG